MLKGFARQQISAASSVASETQWHASQTVLTLSKSFPAGPRAGGVPSDTSLYLRDETHDIHQISSDTARYHKISHDTHRFTSDALIFLKSSRPCWLNT